MMIEPHYAEDVLIKHDNTLEYGSIALLHPMSAHESGPKIGERS